MGNIDRITVDSDQILKCLDNLKIERPAILHQSKQPQNRAMDSHLPDGQDQLEKKILILEKEIRR